jgi:chorismate synthase
LTNGAPIVFRVAFKPTSSIAKGQDTRNVKSGEMVCLNVPGRHDVCFALRTPVVVEALSAIVLADLQMVCEGLKG